SRSQFEEVVSRSCFLSFQIGQSFPQVHQGAPGITRLAHPGRSNTEIAFSAPATFGRSIAQGGGDEATFLEASQPCIDAGDDDLAVCLRLEFLRDRYSISILAEAHERQQQHQVKVLEIISLPHFFTILNK